MTAKRQWTLLTALACLVVLVAGYMLLVRPQHSKAASIKAQTSGVQSQITTLRSQLARLTEESRDLAGQQAALYRIAQQLPTDPQMPTLLRKLDQSAGVTGVELVNVAPGNPTVATPTVATGAAGGTAASAAPVAKGVTGAPIAGLAQIPVVLTVSGDYFQMERFLDSLEGLQRSMLVNSFTLAYAKTTATSGGSTATVGKGPISATINAQVFLSTAALGSSAAAGGSATTSGSPVAGAATANRVPTAS